MPNLSIKDVPQAWTEALRQRAARNHRSLQGELMALVERAVNEESTPPSAPGGGTAPQGRIVGLDRHGWPIVRHGSKAPEEVFVASDLAYPQPVRGQPLAVDILREDRDSR